MREMGLAFALGVIVASGIWGLSPKPKIVVQFRDARQKAVTPEIVMQDGGCALFPQIVNVAVCSHTERQ